jgi:DnaJ-class molecular chaperone
MRYSFKQQRANSTETEVKCDVCKGTGLQSVHKAAQPGHRIFPAKCPKCAGKGRLKMA